MTDPGDVLRFWFADSLAADAELGPHMRRWFGQDPAFDQAIAGRFGAVIRRAGSGELDGWKATARGRLALIILLDQLTRNAFRGSAAAFAFDPEALRLCAEGLASGADRELAPVERQFFYLPLLHSEQLADQRRSIACFKTLAAEARGPQGRHFTAWIRIARRSRWIIAAFGRFPHRNAVLGRRSTLPEAGFLAAKRLRAATVRLLA